MKNIIYLSILIGLASCAPKTAENSKYSHLISELSRYETGIDSLYKEMLKYPVDSLVLIRERSDMKHGEVKKVYTSDSVDSNYELIMMSVRGQLVKKQRGIESKYSSIVNEFKKTSKQVEVLKQNLIHEAINEKDAQVFYNSEFNAQIILHAELSSYVEDAKNTHKIYPILTRKLDSIIKQYDL